MARNSFALLLCLGCRLGVYLALDVGVGIGWVLCLSTVHLISKIVTALPYFLPYLARSDVK
jgi:hypothetical protein